MKFLWFQTQISMKILVIHEKNKRDHVFLSKSFSNVPITLKIFHLDVDCERGHKFLSWNGIIFQKSFSSFLWDDFWKWWKNFQAENWFFKSKNFLKCQYLTSSQWKVYLFNFEVFNSSKNFSFTFITPKRVNRHLNAVNIDQKL